ncbi:MAG: hypothetical protein CME15_04735 [Gemmatimonadetes bacterium]|nr:hypothetical protein [Gemmatimonadota bacterium]
MFGGLPNTHCQHVGDGDTSAGHLYDLGFKPPSFTGGAEEGEILEELHFAVESAPPATGCTSPSGAVKLKPLDREGQAAIGCRLRVQSGHGGEQTQNPHHCLLLPETVRRIGEVDNAMDSVGLYPDRVLARNAASAPAATAF